MEEAEVVEKAAEEAMEEAAEETPLQEDRHQVTLEEVTIDSSDNRQMYSPEIARRRRSFSRNGNSIIT